MSAAAAPEGRFDPSAFGFDLNGREQAALIYLGLLVAAVLIWPAGRRGLFGVVRAALQPKLLAIYLAMTAYVALVVAGLWWAKAWAPTNLKTTLLWWATVGLGCGFTALKLQSEKDAVRQLVAEAVAWTEIVVFLSEVHTFPLWGELLLLPFLTFVGLLLAFAPRVADGQILVAPLTRIQTYAGVAIIGFSVLGILRDPKDFLTWNNLREFADPILLSLALIPFLYGLAVVMATESNFTSLRILGTDPRLARYAERRALLAFGLDFDGARRLARDLRLQEVSDRAGVRTAIAEIKAQQRRERNPPPVDPDAGWSPYAAIAALSDYGIRAGDYHRSFDEWWAQAPSVKIGDGLFPPHVSYYVSGSEQAATRLRLVLSADFAEPGGAGDGSYQRLAEGLLVWALGAASAATIAPHLLAGKARSFEVPGARVDLEFSTWGAAPRGGYRRGVVIRHPAHMETIDA